MTSTELAIRAAGTVATRPAHRLTDDEVHALAMAEQTGADGVYSGDWRAALRLAAAQWDREGRRASGLTRTGQRALDRARLNLGLTTTNTPDPDEQYPGFTPAWHCGNAEYTLRWSPARLQWELRQHGRLIRALNGYPTGQPARTDTQARAWADTILGPQQWIARPPRSGAHHTHTTTDSACTPATTGRTTGTHAARSAA